MRRKTVKRDQLDRDLAVIQDVRDALKPLDYWRDRARVLLLVLRETWREGYRAAADADNNHEIL